MDLERELKNALSRRDPPQEFSCRVLARIAREREQEASSWWSRLRAPATLRYAFASLLICIVTFTGMSEYRRRQGEIAKARLVLALHIAGSKLNYAQKKTQDLGVNLGGILESTEEKK